ncbi:dihydroorotase [Falsiroseomonas oryziterrae]|uniref:dihydroorotase n=1 Tax=Falsiroseomonas oryziterrae TaxID=2911368 RepID=UPI001F3F74E6|nr:dihydroorotase family protein [Roseomonas sp. NPKOSM-4]
MTALRIAGGTVVTHEAAFRADILIRGERIAAILGPDEPAEATETIDAAGLHILPGAIDVHVHFREPGFAWKETWASGTRAAAAGGVTTVFEMPNTDPATATPDSVAAKIAHAQPQAYVDFGVYGLLSEASLPHLAEMRAAGAVAFKLFLGSDNPRTPCPSDGAVLEAFEALAGLGLRTTIHAENTPILKWREARLKAAGRRDFAAHLEMHADIAAVEATCRAALFAEWTGAKIHIAHESCRHSVPWIAHAKARGVDITAETCPHYLLLSTADEARLPGSFLRVKPPLRGPEHAEPLWRALLDGTIDMISTDHAPHLPAEKARESMWEVAPGFPGVETSMPLMLAQVSAGRMTLSDYVRRSAFNAARAFGLFPRKGLIAPGSDADLVLVDMARRGEVRAASLHSLGNATPFEGFALHGLPVRTLVRGRTVALEGRALDAAGWGRNVAA